MCFMLLEIMLKLCGCIPSWQMKLETIKAGAKQLNDFVRAILTDKKGNKKSLELILYSFSLLSWIGHTRNDHL